jgi:Trk K+ transport system NAD-binding subunit
MKSGKPLRPGANEWESTIFHISPQACLMIDRGLSWDAARLYDPGVPEEESIARRLTDQMRRRLVIQRAVTNPGTPGDPERRRLIVCGDDPLAVRLIEELVNRYQADVVAIIPSRKRNYGPQIWKILGPRRVIQAERLDLDALRTARVDQADALAVVNQDDVGNIHVALQAQELNPDLRLVIRMFNLGLGYGIVKLFRDCRVLSDASMAAPAFVSAALGDAAPVHVRLARRTLFVARREDVRPGDVVCGLAATVATGQPERLLPSKQDQSDLVLAFATGLPAKLLTEHHDDPDDDPFLSESQLIAAQGRQMRIAERPGRFRMWWRRTRKRPFGNIRKLVGRKLRIAAVVLVLLLIIGTGVLGWVEDIGWFNAAYLTILAALGGANADIEVPLAEKLIQMLLTLVSIALIPVITAAVVEAAVSARLALAHGKLTEQVEDHVVVVGLGNVGTRVIRRLHDLGVSVVAIDKSENAKGAQTARTLGIPLIIGDASQAETLRAAWVQHCRALVVVSTDDVINLEAAIQGRALKKKLRVVLRLFDGDFADRVQKAFNINISRSVSYLAAPAFAAAMLEREVIGTIPVNRRVLLLAEAPICAGSLLDSATVAVADDVGEVRVIALNTGDGRTVWSPPGDQVLKPEDVLVVVATRQGLGELLSRSAFPMLDTA